MAEAPDPVPSVTSMSATYTDGPVEPSGHGSNGVELQIELFGVVQVAGPIGPNHTEIQGPQNVEDLTVPQIPEFIQNNAFAQIPSQQSSPLTRSLYAILPVDED
ncbi:unnamed protein product [Rhizoctonia solani]|uniref:Uncharacterized protein n=1 Tax=Rhizoctonia solani TaxID=456999 RepID=A0A8H3D508_9AGAM|nr:unnamed protein product [Rhizoctonia solani]